MTGAVRSAPDAQLVMRGLKTLALRMDRHCQSAQAVAELLQAHAATDIVHYPGLPGFAQHALAKRQMRQFGGMIAFELQGGMAVSYTHLDVYKRQVDLWIGPELVASYLARQAGDDPQTTLTRSFPINDLGNDGYFLAIGARAPDALVERCLLYTSRCV